MTQMWLELDSDLKTAQTPLGTAGSCIWVRLWGMERELGTVHCYKIPFS